MRRELFVKNVPLYVLNWKVKMRLCYCYGKDGKALKKECEILEIPRNHNSFQLLQLV